MTSGEDVRLSKVAHGSDRWLGFPVFVRPTQNLHSESSWPNSTAGSKTLLFRRSSIIAVVLPSFRRTCRPECADPSRSDDVHSAPRDQTVRTRRSARPEPYVGFAKHEPGIRGNSMYLELDVGPLFRQGPHPHGPAKGARPSRFGWSLTSTLGSQRPERASADQR